MILSDKEAIKALNRIRMAELRESIDDMEEDEIDGRTDMQILMDEAVYFLDMYEDDGTIFSDDLREAKEWLRETKNGKTYKLEELSPSYINKCKNHTERARNTVNEYKRLKRFVEGK